MATRFDVRLQGGDSEGDVVRFRPGEEIIGSVEVVSDGDVRCDHLYIRLTWHTEGRGDRDEATVEELDVFQGTLSSNTPVHREIRFRAPREPWSYTGKYVNIVWAIQVSLDVPMSRDQVHNHPIVLAPGR